MIVVLNLLYLPMIKIVLFCVTFEVNHRVHSLLNSLRKTVYKLSIAALGKEHAHIGASSSTFKPRLNSHKSTSKHENKVNNTTLAKFLSSFSDNNVEYNIAWFIVYSTQPYKG